MPGCRQRPRGPRHGQDAAGHPEDHRRHHRRGPPRARPGTRPRRDPRLARPGRRQPRGTGPPRPIWRGERSRPGWEPVDTAGIALPATGIGRTTPPGTPAPAMPPQSACCAPFSASRSTSAERPPAEHAPAVPATSDVHQPWTSGCPAPASTPRPGPHRPGSRRTQGPVRPMQDEHPSVHYPDPSVQLNSGERLGKGPGSRNINTGPRQAAHPATAVRGHEKVPMCGQVEVPACGQLEVLSWCGRAAL